MLDFESLNTKSNITVVRLLDPDSPILNNAVLDWIQGESNTNNYITISPLKVKVSFIANLLQLLLKCVFVG